MRYLLALLALTLSAVSVCAGPDEDVRVRVALALAMANQPTPDAPAVRPRSPDEPSRPTRPPGDGWEWGLPPDRSETSPCWWRYKQPAAHTHDVPQAPSPFAHGVYQTPTVQPVWYARQAPAPGLFRPTLTGFRCVGGG